jgi:hypothetical protein
MYLSNSPLVIAATVALMLGLSAEDVSARPRWCPRAADSLPPTTRPAAGELSAAEQTPANSVEPPVISESLPIAPATRPAAPGNAGRAGNAGSAGGPGGRRHGQRAGDANPANPPGRGPGAGAGAGMPQAMRLIHRLIDQRSQIHRRTEEVPGGMLTLTTSDNPDLAQVIRRHVRQMKDRFDAGQPIRMWDPLYAALFAQRHLIRLDVEDVPGGAAVRHTSSDPWVTALIRRHAGAVDEFLARGYERVHEATDLPARPAEALPRQ